MSKGWLALSRTGVEMCNLQMDDDRDRLPEKCRGGDESD
jgi:hypothetical protein